MCVNSCGALSSLQPWARAGSEVALLSARAWAREGPGLGEQRVVMESNVSWSSFPFRFLKPSWPFSLNPISSRLESSQGPQCSAVG